MRHLDHLVHWSSDPYLEKTLGDFQALTRLETPTHYSAREEALGPSRPPLRLPGCGQTP
jgi:hypothetical protein